MEAVAEHKLVILMDEKRLNEIKGTELENKLVSMFGGAVKSLVMNVSEEQCNRLLTSFLSCRIDSMGYIEELPVSFKKALYKEVVQRGSLDSSALDAVIDKAASLKDSRLEPPE